MLFEADRTNADIAEAGPNFALSGYFVVNGTGGAAGLVTLASIKETPRPAWPQTTVSQVMVPLERLDTIRPDARLWSALEKMGREGVNQLPVVDGNGIVGMLSRDDVMHYLGIL